MKGNITLIGAGPGISQAVARRFGREGHPIGLVGRQALRLEALRDELRGEGIQAMAAPADAANPHELQAALETLRDSLGHADMVLFNASAVVPGDLLQQDWDNFRSAFDLNVGGLFHLMRLVLPFYLERGHGKVFVTGGGLALAGDPDWTTLSVGKAAQRNLVQAYQKRVEGTGVHVAQVIVRGFVRPDDPKYNAPAIAEQFWRLFGQPPGQRELELIY